MDPKDFLNDLDELMPEHPYKARWLKELDAHLEDFEEDLNREDQVLSPLTLTQRMGTPKRILNDFYKTLHPWRTIYYLAEALFTGLLILLISLGMVSVNWAMSDFISSLFGLETLNRSGVTFAGIFALIFMCAIWSLVHAFNWRQCYSVKKETGRSILPWVFITLSPVFIVMGAWYAKLISFALSDYQACADCEPLWVGILRWSLSIGIFLSIFLGTAWWTRRSLLKNVDGWQASTHPIKKKRKWRRGLDLVFGLYLISYGLLRLLDTYSVGPSLETGIINIVYAPIFISEWMLMMLGVFILPGNDRVISLALPYIYVTGTLLFFIFLQPCIHMIYKKQWSWIRVGIMLWVLHLLFTNPGMYEPMLTFNKPYIIASNVIEKEQAGPFYGLLKYTNQDEGNLFHYAVDLQNGEFILQQNSGYEFRFTPENFETKLGEIMEQKTRIDSMTAETVTWPEDFYCESLETSPEEGTISILPSPEDEYGRLMVCHELFFQEESIYKTASWGEIRDVAISDDGRWMLLVVKSGAYDPDYVYLIEL